EPEPDVPPVASARPASEIWTESDRPALAPVVPLVPVVGWALGASAAGAWTPPVGFCAVGRTESSDFPLIFMACLLASEYRSGASELYRRPRPSESDVHASRPRRRVRGLA